MNGLQGFSSDIWVLVFVSGHPIFIHFRVRIFSLISINLTLYVHIKFNQNKLNDMFTPKLCQLESKP